MKSKIYKKFTLENKILLSSSALDYLSSLESIDFDFIITELKKTGCTLLTGELAQSIINTQNKSLCTNDFFMIKDYFFKFKSESFLYEDFKSKFNMKIESIQNLKEKEDVNIFGIFYLNNKNEEVLEDSYGIIPLDLSYCNDKIFLYEKMFIGCVGKLDNKVFKVKEIFLPKLKSTQSKNNHLKEMNFTFLVFFDISFTKESIKSLRRIIEKQKPTMVFFLGKYEKEESSMFIDEYKHILLFFIHSKDDLPRKFQPISSGKNYKIITNPGEIIFNNFKIGFVVSELFSYKVKGRFINKNYQESFVTSYLSQGSYNPFANIDYSYEHIPSIIFVGQNSFAGVLNFQGVNFVSVSSFDKSGVYFKCDNYFNIVLCDCNEEDSE